MDISHYKKTCPTCGKVFIQSHGNQLTCSTECRLKREWMKRQANPNSKRKTLMPIPCKICNGLFMPKHGNQKIRSIVCREKVEKAKMKKTKKALETIPQQQACMTGIHGELLILGYLIAFGPVTWPQIMFHFKGCITEYRPSLFSVMTIRLAEDGMIAATKEHGRSIYDITSAGRYYYGQRRAQYQIFVREFDHCLAGLDEIKESPTHQ